MHNLPSHLRHACGVCMGKKLICCNMCTQNLISICKGPALLLCTYEMNGNLLHSQDATCEVLLYGAATMLCQGLHIGKHETPNVFVMHGCTRSV